MSHAHSNNSAAPSVGAPSEPQAQRERCALAPGSVIGRSKNITILEYEKRGRRWRRDVDDLSGWWCVRIDHTDYTLWDCGDGLWVEPNGQTMLYPSREDAAEKAAPYGRAGKVIAATEAFSPNNRNEPRAE